MPDLALGWRYLAGHAVATDLSSRDRAEWPPHPARVFMAMAAAWFETRPGEGAPRADVQASEAEGDALRWLEELGDPFLVAPPSEKVGWRTAPTVFVPVNDDDAVRTPSAAPVQSAPAITRVRQGRTFPQVWVGDAPCFLLWRELQAADVDRHRPALERLCGKVTRIGHSSSLVQMWVADEAADEARSLETWEPDELAAEFRVRPISAGLLAMLEERFGEGARRRAEQVDQEIASLDEQARAIRGRGSRERKREIRERIEQLQRERSGIPVRPPLRPTIGVWRGYRRRRPVPEDPKAVEGVFDPDMLVLALDAGPALPATATLLAATALRNALLSGAHSHLCGCDVWNQGTPRPDEAAACWSKIPSWLSGHEPDGSPLRSGEHLAIVPLPFVGSRHADGHLVGMALVFPREVDRRDRGRVLGPVLLGTNGLPRTLRLTLGRAGAVEAALKDPTDSRAALQPETWTSLGGRSGRRVGSRIWASATPVVLDRFPKADRCSAYSEWRREVEELIASSCERVGLPAPASVDIGTTSWLRGSPRAFVKRRPLRASRQLADHRSAPLGDGFPFLVSHDGHHARPQVHARLVFAEPVLGPVLLGAGRYRGYGLLRPIREEEVRC